MSALTVLQYYDSAEKIWRLRHRMRHITQNQEGFPNAWTEMTIICSYTYNEGYVIEMDCEGVCKGSTDMRWNCMLMTMYTDVLQGRGTSKWRTWHRRLAHSCLGKAGQKAIRYGAHVNAKQSNSQTASQVNASRLLRKMWGTAERECCQSGTLRQTWGLLMSELDGDTWCSGTSLLKDWTSIWNQTIRRENLKSTVHTWQLQKRGAIS